MENQRDSLLEVRLDPTGVALLKRLSVSTRWLFIIGLILTLLFLLDAGIRLAFIHPERFASNLPLYLEARLHGWYTLLYCILFIFQLRFYLLFVRQARKGAEVADTALFNDSFQALNKSNVMAIIQLSASVFMGVLEVWANFSISQMLIRH